MSCPDTSTLLPPIPLVFPIVDGSWELRILVTDLQVPSPENPESGSKINFEIGISTYLSQTFDNLEVWDRFKNRPQEPILKYIHTIYFRRNCQFFEAGNTVTL
jgi:hypothetical protein